MDESLNLNPILFYCRDCKKIVDSPLRKGTKYEYSCPQCKSDRVAFGTEKAITDFFQVSRLGLKAGLKQAKKDA